MDNSVKNYRINIITENIFHNVKAFLQSTTSFRFILIITSAMFLTDICFNLLYIPFGDYDIKWFRFPDEDKSILMFIVAVTFAPLFETWLCQYLPYKLLCKSKFFRERKYLILIASALFFGINHFYSLFYIIFGILMGTILMYGYMVRIKSDKHTFLLIAICHSLMNCGAFLLSRYFG